MSQGTTGFAQRYRQEQMEIDRQTSLYSMDVSDIEELVKDGIWSDEKAEKVSRAIFVAMRYVPREESEVRRIWTALGPHKTAIEERVTSKYLSEAIIAKEPSIRDHFDRLNTLVPLSVLKDYSLEERVIFTQYVIRAMPENEAIFQEDVFRIWIELASMLYHPSDRPSEYQWSLFRRLGLEKVTVLRDICLKIGVNRGITSTVVNNRELFQQLSYLSMAHLKRVAQLPPPLLALFDKRAHNTPQEVIQFLLTDHGVELVAVIEKCNECFGLDWHFPGLAGNFILSFLRQNPTVSSTSFIQFLDVTQNKGISHSFGNLISMWHQYEKLNPKYRDASIHVAKESGVKDWKNILRFALMVEVIDNDALVGQFYDFAAKEEINIRQMGDLAVKFFLSIHPDCLTIIDDKLAHIDYTNPYRKHQSEKKAATYSSLVLRACSFLAADAFNVVKLGVDVVMRLQEPLTLINHTNLLALPDLYERVVEQAGSTHDKVDVLRLIVRVDSEKISTLVDYLNQEGVSRGTKEKIWHDLTLCEKVLATSSRFIDKAFEHVDKALRTDMPCDDLVITLSDYVSVLHLYQASSRRSDFSPPEAFVTVDQTLKVIGPPQLSTPDPVRFHLFNRLLNLEGTREWREKVIEVFEMPIVVLIGEIEGIEIPERRHDSDLFVVSSESTVESVTTRLIHHENRYIPKQFAQHLGFNARVTTTLSSLSSMTSSLFASGASLLGYGADPTPATPIVDKVVKPLCGPTTEVHLTAAGSILKTSSQEDVYIPMHLKSIRGGRGIVARAMEALYQLDIAGHLEQKALISLNRSAKEVLESPVMHGSDIRFNQWYSALNQCVKPDEFLFLISIKPLAKPTEESQLVIALANKPVFRFLKPAQLELLALRMESFSDITVMPEAVLAIRQFDLSHPLMECFNKTEGQTTYYDSSKPMRAFEFLENVALKAYIEGYLTDGEVSALLMLATVRFDPNIESIMSIDSPECKERVIGSCSPTRYGGYMPKIVGKTQKEVGENIWSHLVSGAMSVSPIERSLLVANVSRYSAWVEVMRQIHYLSGDKLICPVPSLIDAFNRSCFHRDAVLCDGPFGYTSKLAPWESAAKRPVSAPIAGGFYPDVHDLATESATYILVHDMAHLDLHSIICKEVRAIVMSLACHIRLKRESISKENPMHKRLLDAFIKLTDVMNEPLRARSYENGEYGLSLDEHKKNPGYVLSQLGVVCENFGVKDVYDLWSVDMVKKHPELAAPVKEF